MASFQARSPLRSAHPLLIINKLLSLLAFTFLMTAGWVALSYLKSELIDGGHKGPEPTVVASINNPADKPQADEFESLKVKTLSAPVRLVYSCDGEQGHYHASSHLPSKCERTALSEEAALLRGLKPCQVCIPQ